MKNFKHKKIFLAGLLVCLLMVFLLPPIHNVSAQNTGSANNTALATGNVWAGILSWITLGLANALGKILTLVMDMLNKVFTWQKFNLPEITIGWTAVRDLCNMFFILILLLIAFASILRLENYSLKRLLPKLLIMAVLINFSKTICFLLIDFSQVVMLTFANAFAGNASNFVTAMGIDKVYALSRQIGAFTDLPWDVFYASLASLVVIGIALIIMVMMLGILIMRIVMFWVLIILSPLAFLAYVLPGGGFFSKWWSEFSRYLIVGPALAFFVWLALVVLGSTDISSTMINCTSITGCTSDEINAIQTAIGDWKNLSKFVLAIGLLVGAMKVTKSSGAMGAGAGLALASAVRRRGTAMGRKIGKGAVNLGKSTAKNVAKTSGRIGLAGAGNVLQRWGTDKEGNARTSIVGEGAHRMGTFMGGWSADMKKTREEEKARKRLRTLEKMGMGEKALPAMKKLAESRAGRAIKTGAMVTTAGAVGLATGGAGLGVAAAGTVAALRRAVGASKRRSEKKEEKRKSEQGALGERKKVEMGKAEKIRDASLKGLDYLHKYGPADRTRKIEADRKNKINDLDKTKDKAIHKLDMELKFHKINKAEHDTRVEEVKKVHTRKRNEVEDEYRDHIKAAKGRQITDREYEQRKNEIKQNYSNRKNEIDARFTGQSKAIDARVDKEQGRIGRQMKKYQPNRVTVEAAALGAREDGIAQKKVEVLAKGEDVHRFPASDFYSASGMTSLHRKFFDNLVSGSKESVNAIKNMVATMQKMQGNEGNYQDKQLDAIRSLKQGIAAFKKSGGDTSKLSGVIEVANRIDTRGVDGNKTVQDFESSVIESK